MILVLDHVRLCAHNIPVRVLMPFVGKAKADTHADAATEQF